MKNKTNIGRPVEVTEKHGTWVGYLVEFCTMSHGLNSSGTGAIVQNNDGDIEMYPLKAIRFIDHEVTQ